MSYVDADLTRSLPLKLPELEHKYCDGVAFVTYVTRDAREERPASSIAENINYYCTSSRNPTSC